MYRGWAFQQNRSLRRLGGGNWVRRGEKVPSPDAPPSHCSLLAAVKGLYRNGLCPRAQLTGQGACLILSDILCLASAPSDFPVCAGAF